MLIHDENDLRTGLRVLGEATPPQPAERVVRAVRRARRIKRRRAATVLALAVPVIAVGVRLPLVRSAPDYASPATWPDRRDPTLHALADNALDHWLGHGMRNVFRQGESVHWLYAGRPPGTMDVVVAFATCAGDVCSRAVVTRANAVGLPRDVESSSSPWVFTEYVLGKADPAPVLSTYLADGASPDDGARNIAFVLPSPAAAQVTWSSAARVPGTGGRGALARQADGSFVGSLGYLSARPAIVVRDADGDVLHEGGVGDADDVPKMRLLPEVEVPAGWDGVSWSRGQAENHPIGYSDLSADEPPYAVFVRCEGSRPLRVTVGGKRYLPTCDGQSRLVADSLLPVRGELEVLFDSRDPYLVYSWALAKRV